MTNKFTAFLVLSFVLAVLTLTTSLAAKLDSTIYKESGSVLLERLTLLDKPSEKVGELDIWVMLKVYGYTKGILYALEFEGALCIPKKITAGQLSRIAQKFLKDHPERVYEWDYLLIRAALIEAFPCTSED